MNYIQYKNLYKERGCNVFLDDNFYVSNVISMVCFVAFITMWMLLVLLLVLA